MKTLVFHGETGTAAEILLAGGLVGVPTETVYGLAADGLNPDAVARIYEVKGRPETKPISLLIPDMAGAERFCREIPDEACALAAAFWPGPLTMILRKRDNVPSVVTAGGDTVGVRCPDHPLTLRLLREAATPLATPSANISGKKSPVSAAEVLSYFDGKIEAVIDGGACSVGVASTIVDLTGPAPRVLRLGGLSCGTIFEKTGIRVML